MNITSKSRYALKIMMDLAAHQEGLTHRREIASRQGIPLDYMDQILIRLKEHRLIESARGRAGGYRLGRLPKLISTLDIFRAVEDGFAPVRCLDGGVGCFAEDFCQSKDAWTTISSAITHSLSGIILSDLVAGRPLDASLTLVPHDSVAQNLMTRPRSLRKGGSVHETGITEIAEIAEIAEKQKGDSGKLPGTRHSQGPQECRAPRRTHNTLEFKITKDLGQKKS